MYNVQRKKEIAPGELVFHLACIFIRLDKDENYLNLVSEIRIFGEDAIPALEFTLESILEDNEACQTIRKTARDLFLFVGNLAIICFIKTLRILRPVDGDESTLGFPKGMRSPLGLGLLH